MEQLLEFFIAPYRESSTPYIFLEAIAVIFGIVSVIFAKRENILVYPTGIISTAIFIYLLYSWGLLGDMIVNIYYTIMSIYGWIMWSRPGKNDELEISWTTKRDKGITAMIFFTTAIFVIIVYALNDRFDRWTDYVDTFTTGVFFAAMWLMANKKIESWHFWILANIISVPLYFFKGFGLTGIQYIIFLILAVQGLKAWKEIYNKKQFQVS